MKRSKKLVRSNDPILFDWLFKICRKFFRPYEYALSMTLYTYFLMIGFFAIVILAAHLFKKLTFFALDYYFSSLHALPPYISAQRLFFHERVVLFSVVVITGLLLFNLKKKQQFWYGIVETIFALINTINSVSEIQPFIYTDDPKGNLLIIFFASIYLLVRGLSNIDDGLKKEFYLKSYLFTVYSKD